MYGFQLIRGGNLVYNLTGAAVNHPFHSPDVPAWAVAMDDQPIEAVIANLRPDGQAQTDLLQACHHELGRHRRSRTKVGGDDCVVKLVITP